MFYAYFPNVLLDLAAMVFVDSNKEVVGATGHISTRPVSLIVPPRRSFRAS